MNTKIIMLILIFSLSCLLSATIWEINQDGTGDFENIQEGIDAAADGDTVLVHPGTYYENINFLGKDITVASLILTTGDESYIYNTIIDGDREWCVVEFSNNETEYTVLQGLTIRNGGGYGGWSALHSTGGGILIECASPILRDLLVIDNHSHSGGGIFFGGSEAYLENVTIRDNHAYLTGGGIAIARSEGIDSQITFSDENKCNIYNNTAAWGADVGITNAYSFTTHNHIIVDTFTVLNPTGDYATPSPYLELSIDNQWIVPAEHDLYVHPAGNDNNSGATPDDPLRSIQWALTKIDLGADSLNPRTIHLAEGIYSPQNGQLFPLNLRSNVTLRGAGKDKTILKWSELNYILSFFMDARFGNDNITIKDMTLKDLTTPRFAISINFTDALNVNISDIKMYDSDRMGICIFDGENVIIRNSEFYNYNNSTLVVNINKNPDLPISYDKVVLENLIIMNTTPNQFFEYGGTAMQVGTSDFVTISNCLIANNTLLADIWISAAISLGKIKQLYFTNNTVANNHKVPGTWTPTVAISIGSGDTFLFTNNIIYDNSEYTFRLSRSDTPATVYFDNNLIEGGTNPTIIVSGTSGSIPEFIWGEGNIDGPVYFYGEAAGLDPSDPLYYQLTANSPAVDAGTPDTTGLHLPPWDLLYNRRVWDGLGNGEAIIDIGCYEYGAPPYPQSVVSADEPAIEIPQQLSVKNYPNPFNPDTIIEFELPQESVVTLEIFNIKGQKVRKLYDCFSPPGIYSLLWNGKDDNGRQLPSGIYLYKLVTDYEVVTRKMMLLK